MVDRKAHAVEPDQAVEGSGLDVAIPALQQGVDRVDGETILGGPHLVDESHRRPGKIGWLTGFLSLHRHQRSGHEPTKHSSIAGRGPCQGEAG